MARQSNGFQLEALEPRVLLSGDALLVSAVAANALAHKPVETVHQDHVADQHHFQDSISYTPATEAGGIFDGVSAQPIHSTVTESKTAATQTAVQNHEAPAQKTDAAVQSTSVTKTAAVVTPAAKVHDTTGVVSVAATIFSQNVMTRQMTASLNVANAPPGVNTTQSKPSQASNNKTVTNSTGNSQSSATSASSSKTSSSNTTLPGPTTGLWATILTAIGQTTWATSPVSYQNVTLGPLNFSSVSVTYNQSGNTVSLSGTATFAISGDTGSLITSSQISVSGSFATNGTTSPSGSGFALGLTLSGVNSQPITVTIGQALQITLPSVTFNYSPNSTTANEDPLDSGFTGTSAPLVNISGTATVTSPEFSQLTGSVSDFSLWTDGIGFDTFQMTTTQSISIGNFFTATGVTVTVTGGKETPSFFNLAFSNFDQSTAGIDFQANTVQLYPSFNFLNLSFSGIGGSYQLVNAANTGAGSGALTLDIGSVNITAGDAFTIQLQGLVLTPGNASSGGSIATWSSATVDTSLISGVSSFTLNSSDFQLTSQEISLSNINLTPSGGISATIGNYISLQGFQFDITSFTINSTGTITSSMSASATSLTLFPGDSSIISSTINGLAFNFDFSNSGIGALSITASSFSITLADQMTISATGTVTDPITFTPDAQTILSLGSTATINVSFADLSGLAGTIGGLTITQTGFDIASATLSYTPTTPLDLGGVLDFSGTPSVTLTNVSYTLGGSLGGLVAFNSGTVTLNMGSVAAGAITASGTFSGSYDLETSTLTGNLTNGTGPLISVPGFVSVSGNLALMYQPGTSGTTTFLIGGNDINLFLGYDGGTTPVGLQISNAAFGLVIYDTSGTLTFAFDATSSGISFSGLPNLPGSSSSPLTFSAGSVQVEFNDTNGVVKQAVNVDGNPADAIQLNFAGNITSLAVSDLTLNVAGIITLSGNFGFQTVPDSTNPAQIDDLVIGATDVNAMIGTTSGPNLQINGASLGLVVVLPVDGSSTTLALMVNGGTDSLNNVPGLSISSYTLSSSSVSFTGLSIDLNTTPNGLGGSAWSLPNNLQSVVITTPDSSMTLDFTAAGTDPVNFSTLQPGSSSNPFIGVLGPLELDIAGVVTLSGEFSFDSFTPVGSTTSDILIGGTDINATIGTSTANFSITNASLAVVVVPGTAPALPTYALEATGGFSLNGFPALTLSGSASLEINDTGVEPSTLVPSGITIPTLNGNVSASTVFSNFTSNSNITDIEGSLTLDAYIPNSTDLFASLSGNFGIDVFPDPTTGLTDFAIGATDVDVTLGTSSMGLSIQEASLALLVRAGANGGSATYALTVDGGTDTLTLPDISQVSFGAGGFTLNINELGVDPSTLGGIPTQIQTPGGAVSFSFPTYGSTMFEDVEVTGISFSIGNFVTVTGNLAIQTFADPTTSGVSDLAIAATDVNASVSAGGVSLTLTGASLGMLMVPGTTTNYALVVTGGTDALTGVPGLTLSATGLSVYVNTGITPSTYLGSASAIVTSAGSVPLVFTGLGTGPVTDVEGTITLTISNFVSLSGDFWFQEFSATINNTTEQGILAGGSGITAVLGEGTTNLTISGASFDLLMVPGGSGPTYALVANGQTDQLNGVSGLSLSASDLSVEVNNNVSSAWITAADSQSIMTSAGTVTPSFSGLLSGTMTEVEGSVTLNVAGFVSLSGNFSFTEKPDATGIEIDVGADDVNAFLGTANQSVGVGIVNAELGLVIYKNTTANTTTYALYASAPLKLYGLPSEMNLSGTVDVEINTTGGAVSDNITTPDNGSVPISFSATQGKLESFSVTGLNLTITPTTGTSFSLTGNFGFATAVVSGQTELEIGATNIATSSIIPDGGSAVSITNGTLGIVIFTGSTGNEGYALTASATVTTTVGGVSGGLTLEILRNTTSNPINQTVTVGGASVPVVFSASQIASGGTAFQTISISSASLNIENTLIIAATNNGSSSSEGVTTQNLSGVTLTLQDPGTGNVYLTMTAASASYSTIAAGINYDNKTWTNGGYDVQLTNLTLSLGGYVVFTGTVDIQYQKASGSSTAATLTFNFTSASITFNENAGTNPLVTIAGSFAFSYSSSTGLSLDGTPTISGVSFLGETLGSTAVSSVVSAVAIPGSSTSGTLGPITLGTPSISLTDFSLNPSGALSVTVNISDKGAGINSTVGPVSVNATADLEGSFTVGMTFNLADPISAPTNINAGNFVLTLNNLNMTVTVTGGVAFTLTAASVSINPEAGPTQDAVSFDSSSSLPALSGTLDVGGLQFTATASNFAITGNGDFVAENNFSISLSFGANSSATGFSWPSWLPLQNLTMGLAWTNFNTDPIDCIITLSATVSTSLPGTQLSITGTVNNLEISVADLVAGEFPIIGLGSVGLSVTGSLFGGTVSGTVLIGVAQFNADGTVVNQFDSTATATPLDSGAGVYSVIYGGLSATWTAPGGTAGFTIQIGLTEYGPLSIYFSVTTPIELPDDLILASFDGGVAFGESLPTLTIQYSGGQPEASSALQLQTLSFQPLGQQTINQWQSQLAQQVATLYAPSFKNGNTIPNGWSNLGNAPILIQAGGTLTTGDIADVAADEAVFSVSANIDFDTTGKFLITGSATFGSNISLNVSLYADLSSVFGTSNDPVFILFLMDVPSPPSLSPYLGSTPLLQVYGVMTFSNTSSGLQIDIAGAADLTLPGGVYADLTGTLALDFTSTSFQMTLSNVSLSVSYLGTIGTAAGSLTIQKDGSGVDVWGALIVELNASASASGLPLSGGINVSGFLEFEINTTSAVQPVTLTGVPSTVTEPNGTVANLSSTLNLAPNTFLLLVTGGATVTLEGLQIFDISGTLDIYFNGSSLTIFVNAILDVGPSGFNYLSFNATGLFYVDQNGFAALATLQIVDNTNSGYTLAGNFLLAMNTTGETNPIEFIIPNVSNSPIPKVTGPNFNGNGTVLYENDTINPGERTLIIPAGPPPSGTTNYANWINGSASTTPTPGIYFIIVGEGTLTLNPLPVSNTLALVLTGAINIEASDTGGNIVFSFVLDAGLNLAIGGTNIFSFNANGGIEITNQGLIAELSLSLNGGLPSGLNFTLGASVTFDLEINTTGTATQVPGTNITVQPGALVAINGSLSIPGFTLTGSFDLQITSSYLAVTVTATASLLGITVNVDGAAEILYGNGQDGFALDIMLSVGSGAPGSVCTFYPIPGEATLFEVQAVMELELNTSSKSVQLNGKQVSPGFLISLSNVNCYLVDLFDFTGSGSVSITSSGDFSLSLSVAFNFVIDGSTLFSLSISGAVNLDPGNPSNDSFSFSANASFNEGWSYDGFGGSVYAYISISFSYSSSAGLQWSFSAGCGIHVDDIGSLSVGGSLGENGNEFYLNISIDLWVCDITLPIDLGPTSPEPTPPPPVLATQVGSVLYLNYGADVTNREDGTDYGPITNEDYTINESGGAITVMGDVEDPTDNTVETYTQSPAFTGVTSIVVDGTEDSGGVTQTDTLTIDSGVTASVIVTLDNNNSTITNHGSGTTTIYNYGSGNNTINAGSGATAFYDYGTGTNTINLGSGGGIYYGGETSLMPGSPTYSSKGVTYISNPGSNFSVVESGYTQYVLSNSGLTYGSYQLIMTAGVINNITLNGAASGGTTFTFDSWTGTATVNGQGYNNTIVATSGGNQSLAFNLTNNSLQISVNGSLTQRISFYDVQTANLNGGHGANTFTVYSWNGIANLNGEDGDSTYDLTLSGTGAGTINVSDSTVGSNDKLNLSAGNSMIITNDQLKVGSQLVNYGGVATLNITGTAAALTYDVRSTYGATTTTLNTDSGVNTINIGSLAPSGDGVTDGIQGALTINGDGSDVLNVDDSGNITGENGAQAGVLTADTLTGLNMGVAGITYKRIASLDISLGSGGDTFDVESTYKDTVTTLNTGSGVNAVNVTDGGVLTGISGELIVNGQGTDTLNLDDTADTGPGILTQTTTTLTGLGLGVNGIVYKNIETLNINLGAFNNIVYIQGNPAITTTTLNAGSGTNIISIGSSAQSSITTDPTTGNAENTGSVLDNVQGIINIVGSGKDTMNVDDSGSTLGVTGALTADQLSFYGLAIINYSGIVAINISLSEGNNEFAITDTIASSSTTPAIVIDGNLGSSTFLVMSTQAVMTINGGSGNDNFYIFGNSSTLDLNGDGGVNNFYVYASVSATTSGQTGEDSNGGGNYSYNVNAPVDINGGATGSLFMFGTVLNDAILVNGTQVTGAGLDVSFSNIGQLTFSGLGGNNIFYIETVVVSTTVIGNGTLVLPTLPGSLASLGVTLPNLAGDAPVATSFNNLFYVGWQGESYIPGSLTGIDATLTISEGSVGTATAYVNDTSAIYNQNYTLTPTTLTSSDMGSNGQIVYDSTIDNLVLLLGSGENNITVNGTGAGVQTVINGGLGDDDFTVNGSPNLLASLLVLIGGGNLFPGNTLTVNGSGAGNNFTVTGSTIGGLGASIEYEQIQTITVNGIGGDNTFVVNGETVPTYLYGGTGNDSFTVFSSIGPLDITGGSSADGSDTFTINGNSGMLTATGGAGNNSFTVNGNAGTLTLNGSGSGNFFTINGNGGKLTLNGSSVIDSFTVNALGTPATINAGSGAESIIVNAPLAASLTVNGAGSADLLTINGISGNDYFIITGTSVSGVGSPIYYGGIGALIVNGGVGNNTFLIESDSATTTVNGNTENNLFYVQTTSAPTIINTAGESNIVDIGSNVPVPGSGVLYDIQGAITVNGNGRVTLNIDDSGDGIAGTGTLTSSALTGFGMATGGISYNGIPSLNLTLGYGNDTLNIQGTNAATVTYISTTGGAITFNIGSLEPQSGGVLGGIQGALTIDGDGSDIMNVDDIGDAAAQSGILTPTTLTGLGMAATGVVYSGFTSVTISLGSGGNTFTIENTNSTTAITLNSGSGNDIVNLLADSGVTNINGQGGDNVINVQSTNGTTTVNMGTGSVVNVGSLAPGTGGVLSTIESELIVTGQGDDTMNVDNSGDTAPESGTLTALTLTGFGLGESGIVYSGVTTLNILLGPGGNSLTITGAAPVTTVTGGKGSNSATMDFAGNFAVDLTLIEFATASLSVGGNFSGQLTDAGAITTANITDSLTGVLDAGSIATMTIGGDLAGTLDVTGLLGTLTVDGGTPGQIIVGNVQVITVLAGYGNIVFNLTENGVQREILAVPVEGGTLPDTIHFAFVYDSELASAPQVAIQITNTDPLPRSFNLELVVTNSATAQFNLALVDSYENESSGVSNISVDGSLLSKLTTPELQLFTTLTSSSHGGVVLPSDSITGVEVSGALPEGFIDVAGIEGVAFGLVTNGAGKSVALGTGVSINGIWVLLGTHAAINPATDTFIIPFYATQSVKLFARINTSLRMALVMTLTDSIPNSLPITAYVQIIPTSSNNVNPLVESITLFGNGASINSPYSIANITSNGSLGNITITASSSTTVDNAAGLGNVTATSIFGDIDVTHAGIYGVIQTTVGDIGQFVVNKNGKITGVTTIFARGAITGEIISAGNIISAITTDGNFSGVIAAQGNLGTIEVGSSPLKQLGGITIKGADSGQIIALGNIYGNLTISGTMTGRIAAEAEAITGLPAAGAGILGNVTVKLFASGAAIISGGLIGDATDHTTVKLGKARGFVAADGSVNLKSTTFAAGNLIQNATGSNLSAIAAVFSNGSLANLALIETNLNDIQDNNGVLS